MKKTALITGILGQDGPYLAKLLLEKDYRVYGLIRRYTNPNFSNLDYLGITRDVEYVDGDLSDEGSLMNLIKVIKPNEVYNLGAQSFVGASWDIARQTTEVNALGVLYLLNAIKFFSPTTKMYQASTSEMYGSAQNDKGQDENTPFHPESPYAIAKLYAYWTVRNFRSAFGLFAANGILFNHESPIRGIQFVTRKITDGVARIKLGKANEIRLGNLGAKRDWGFAGDYVKAMHLILQQREPDDFVVGMGHSHTVSDFVEAAFKCVGIKDWTKYVKIDPRFKRPVDVHSLKADSTKAKKILKWKPSVSFESLVEMMVSADMERLSKA